MRTWFDFVWMTSQERAKAGIYEMSMACACGLPDTADMDEALCGRVLEGLVEFVRDFTAQNRRLLVTEPQTFQGSDVRYKIFGLVRGLQKFQGVRYNPAKVAPDAVFESADSFLYGLLQTGLGTCATLPVLYVTIGRRLGYPLYLVQARSDTSGHLYFRWDDGQVRLNVETTAGVLAYPPDEHYCTGPYRRSEPAIQMGRLLISHTPEDDLAGFLCERAHRWLYFGNYREALHTFLWAKAVQPLNGFIDNSIRQVQADWSNKLSWQTPRHSFPDLHCVWSQPRVFPLAVPLVVEQDVLRLGVLEHLLTDRGVERDWLGALRRDDFSAARPGQVVATFRPDGSFTLESRNRCPLVHDWKVREERRQPLANPSEYSYDCDPPGFGTIGLN
jgi:hypothetical protein